ncbi:MAG: pyridoxamine 5'-phosphate oxidase family protein [Coriobacteriales bacterium]|jgi:uncharacterized pyridoxamine 5'-phosphate oxidase family protein|nr:pyridoxamine 5'-phosphate oxidase family protein [Coriobacteriales bacterium]
MKKVYEFLKKVQTYYLATTAGDQPHVRPFGTIDLFEDRLYIQTGKSKDVFAQISANPKVEICAFDPEDGSWIRVAGSLVVDERTEAEQHLLDAYPQLAERYQAGDGNNRVLYLKDATATFFSFTSEPETISF